MLKFGKLFVINRCKFLGIYVIDSELNKFLDETPKLVLKRRISFGFNYEIKFIKRDYCYSIQFFYNISVFIVFIYLKAQVLFTIRETTYS